jgi:type IV pilus assembly protein PilZ
MTETAKPAVAQAASRPSVLSLNINSKSALYAGYMPHLKNGGIFIPTSRGYNLGDEVFMLLSLMDDPAKLPIAGTVVWVTPAGAQNSKAQGIGVHFNAARSKACLAVSCNPAARPIPSSPPAFFSALPHRCWSIRIAIWILKIFPAACLMFLRE